MIIEIETHPLQPFLPENARLLMLGSFPPPRNKWKMDFYYPNFQNDMWRIFGLIFFQDKTYFLSENQKSFNEEAIRSFLIETGIAIFDTAYQIKRLKGNASDKFLEIVTPTDLAVLVIRKLHHPLNWQIRDSFNHCSLKTAGSRVFIIFNDLSVCLVI